MKDQIRKEFIIGSAKITGVAVGTATLGQKLLLPQTVEAENIQFSNSSCGYKGDHQILVADASQFGTTREVTEVIGKILCQGGARAEVKRVKDVKDFKNYDAVIIGSAIKYDKWMPEAIKFVTAHQNSLSKLPVAYFFTCLTLSKQSEKAEHKAMAYSDKLYSLVPQVKPLSVGRFAGVLDYSKMSFFSRLIFKGILSIMGVQEGDYRDWNAIRSWAKGIHLKLADERARTHRCLPHRFSRPGYAN